MEPKDVAARLQGIFRFSDECRDDIVFSLNAAQIEPVALIRELMELVETVDGHGGGDGAFVKLPAWQRAEAFLARKNPGG